MRAKRNRLISTIGLSALVAIPATVAIAADGDGGEKLAQPNVALQQPAPATTVPAVQGASAEERLRWIPGPEQLNVPGNPAFGRVAST
jgi:hypothetical protein